MTAYAYYKDCLGLKQEKLLQTLAERTRYGSGKKGDLLIQQGEICNDIFLLESGVARGFIINEEGEEMTDCLIRSEWEIAVTGLVHLELNQPAFDSVELLENTSFFALPIADVLELSEQYAEVSKLYLTILERSWNNQATVKRARYTLTVEERLLWFQTTYPGMDSCMRKKDIASFLNMKAQTLSKISGKYKSR